MDKCEIHNWRLQRTVTRDTKTAKAGDVYCTHCCKKVGEICRAHVRGDLCDACRPLAGFIGSPGERFA